MQLYPMKTIPIFKERIWGGQKLREFFGKPIPQGKRIGESWELSDLTSDKSTIANGSLAGKTLREVMDNWPEQMLGDSRPVSTFGLLIKFINAEDVLSVQVHPDRATCERMGKGEPKTECWYIISAAKDAVIYKGLKEGITREMFAEAIESGDVDKLLNKVEVKAGQCHFLPAGTAHAIGAGLLIAEIQTPSNTTYRAFDWNRLDDQGKPRELHIPEALESINFAQKSDELAVTEIGRLVESEFFSIDKRHQAKDCEELLKKGSFEVIVFLSGSGDIVDGNDQRFDFKAGDCFFIPAAYQGALCFSEDTEYLVVTM